MSDTSARYPCFDALRLLGGTMVLFSHSFPLTGHAEPIAFRLGDEEVNVGHAGVIIFFTISGFLVATSWARAPRPGTFALKRAARIWPAFLVVVALAALVVGPALTDLPLDRYLGDPRTRSYLLDNALMSPIRYGLPGTFAGLPYTAANGSLWTLPYEVLAYVGVLIAGVLGLLRRPRPAAGFVALLLLHRMGVAGHAVSLDWWFNGLGLGPAVSLCVWFAAGVVLAGHRDLIVGRHRHAALAVPVAVAGLVAGEPLLAIPALSFLVLYVATLDLPAASVVGRAGDPTYGIYLYGFLVQQVLIASGLAAMNPWLLFVEAAPVTAACGYASWHLVERPVLRLMARRRAPVPVAR